MWNYLRFTSLNLVLIFTLCVTQISHAQNAPVSARVDRSHVALNQTLTFIITVVGENSTAPTLPAMDGLAVVGSSRAAQTSIVNGQVSSQISYRYTLQPSREGERVIPSVRVDVDGRTYLTDPLTIAVTPAVGSPPGGGSNFSNSPAASASADKDLLVRAAVDNPNPYLGEQITYFFRFYQAVSLFDKPEYDAPDFGGFWNQQEVDQKQYTEQLDGRGYRVSELRTVLFPTVIGEQTIAPATLNIRSSLFQRGVVLQTAPVPVNVKPLPEPIPSNFSGAVGQLTIAAAAQTKASDSSNPLTVEVDEPVTLRIVLDGAGNFETFGEIELPELADWRSFDSTEQLDTRLKDGKLLGTRVVEQLLVPVQPGYYEIPAISYIYFDPESDAYQTAATAPIQIRVVGEPAGNSSSSSAGAQTATAPADAQSALGDIRFIKDVPATLSGVARPLSKRPLFWALWLLPLLMLVGDWHLRRRKSHVVADPVATRRSQALRHARRLLHKGRNNGSDPYAVASAVLLGYLSDKLARPVGGLTHAELQTHLRQAGLDVKLIARVQTLLSVSELNRFAPANVNSSPPNGITGEAESILKELEKVFNDRAVGKSLPAKEALHKGFAK